MVFALWLKSWKKCFRFVVDFRFVITRKSTTKRTPFSTFSTTKRTLLLFFMGSHFKLLDMSKRHYFVLFLHYSTTNEHRFTLFDYKKIKRKSTTKRTPFFPLFQPQSEHHYYFALEAILNCWICQNVIILHYLCTILLFRSYNPN